MNEAYRYENKLFSVLGDSISTLEGYSEPEDAVFYEGMNRLSANVLFEEDTWWGQVIGRLGGRLLVNNSFSGSTVIKHRSCMIPSYGCSDERTSSLGCDGTDPDVIMVYMGTNDWGCGARLRPKEEKDSYDLAFFSVAYEKMLTKLKENYPGAEIWCFTLPVSTCKSREDFEFPYCHGGIHIEEYCKIIRELSEKHRCKMIDLYKEQIWFDTVDGFHPTSEGMKMISDAIIRQLLADK